MTSNNFFNNKSHVENLSDKWDEFSTRFISEYKAGELNKDDVLNVAKKVAKYRGDNNLVEMIKQRMGLA